MLIVGGIKIKFPSYRKLIANYRKVIKKQRRVANERKPTQGASTTKRENLIKGKLIFASSVLPSFSIQDGEVHYVLCFRRNAD